MEFERLARKLSAELGEDFYEWVVAMIALKIGVEVLYNFRAQSGVEKTQDLIAMSVIDMLGLKKDKPIVEMYSKLENARSVAADLFIRKLEYVIKSSDGEILTWLNELGKKK